MSKSTLRSGPLAIVLAASFAITDAVYWPTFDGNDRVLVSSPSDP